MNKKLGIISGAGALSGLYLYQQLLSKIILSGVIKDEDFPQIILHNYPFKSMDRSGIFCSKTAIEEINLALIPIIDCEKIIIACNSLHSLINDSRLINLPNLGIENFLTNRILNKKALILCSESSKNLHVFGKNNNIIYLSDSLSKITQKIIESKIVGSNVDEAKYFALVSDEANLLNVSHIIVGCTELSMLNWESYSYLQSIIDCVDLAVEKAVEWHKERNI